MSMQYWPQNMKGGYCVYFQLKSSIFIKVIFLHISAKFYGRYLHPLSIKINPMTF